MERSIRPVFLLTVVVLLFSFTSYTQGQYTQNITVYGAQMVPKKNLEVVLIETSTFKRTVYHTNQAGMLKIELSSDEGQEWMMSVGGMKNYSLLKCPPGSTGSGSSQIYYDVVRWNRENETPLDRTTINLEEVPQRVEAHNLTPSKTHQIFEVELLSKKKVPWGGIKVGMTCYALGTTYTATTDHAGIARFRLPNNNKYQIDVDGEDNFEYHDVGGDSYMQRKTLQYERLNFKEVADEEGYLEQFFLEDPRPISNRVMVKMSIAGGPNGGANEDIYIETDYSKKKYHAKSNKNGELVMLLPKKHTFKVHFEHQRDAGNIDLSRFFGIGYMETGFNYIPDPRLQFPERYLPTKDDVKQYDINNFNTKKYPDTPSEELINVHVKWGNNKINSGCMESLLELGFSVKEPKNKEAISKPLNLAFVLDRSGSMGGEKLDFLKAAMLDFNKKLRPDDKVAIIFFDDTSVVAYDKPTVDKKHIADIIGALQSQGGTNIYGALERGYKIVAKKKTENTVDRVILLTDGYGSKPVDFILEQSKKYFEKGISVSTIGVGESYNSSLLSIISKYSGGLDHQAIKSEGISEALDTEFESLLYPLASDLQVKVTYGNRVIYKTLYGIPEKKKTNTAVTFELDRVYSSLNRMALMKFKIENPRIGEPMLDIDKDKITIAVSYFDELKQKPVEIIKTTNLEWTEETDAELVRDEELKQTYSVAIINQALKSIADLCDLKKYDQARQTLRETKKSLKKITADKYSEDLIPLIEQLSEYIVALDRAIKNNN